MPKYEDELVLDLSSEASWEACREGVTSLGWALQGEGEGYLACKEVGNPAPWVSGHWAVQVEIVVTAEPSGSTRVAIYGSNWGWGPIQSNHVRDQVTKLRSRIDSIAGKRAASGRGQARQAVSSELEKLGQLHAQGVLTDEEFRDAKRRILGT